MQVFGYQNPRHFINTRNGTSGSRNQLIAPITGSPNIAAYDVDHGGLVGTEDCLPGQILASQ